MNSDHEFVCDVYANPPPTIHWLKNGTDITTSDYVQVVNSRTLRILGLMASDAGMYQCMADAGDLGSLQASAQLIVQASGMAVRFCRLYNVCAVVCHFGHYDCFTLNIEHFCFIA